MEKSLADGRRGNYNIGVGVRRRRSGTDPPCPSEKRDAARRSAPVKARVGGQAADAPGSPKPGPPTAVPEGFYRDLVWNLRNGVLAVTRDGRVAVMNDVAYRILALKPRIDRHRPALHARS